LFGNVSDVATAAVDWAELLLPDHIDAGLRQAPDALLVYQRLCWSTPEAAVVTYRAGVAWERPHGAEVERGLWSDAAVDGRTVAETTLVVRHAGRAAAFGTPLLPSPPPIPSAIVDDPLVVTEDEVRAFVARAGSDYSATTTMTAAHRRGFAGLLVPGTLLLVMAIGRAARESHGSVEAWFRGPVPAGAVLTRRRDSDIEALFLAGRARPSVVVRHTAPTSVGDVSR
jgi:hypothetical protein